MNLTEIRDKYPEYNDLTDEQVVGGLHKKFYADLDVKDFHERINYRPPGIYQEETSFTDYAKGWLREKFPSVFKPERQYMPGREVAEAQIAMEAKGKPGRTTEEYKAEVYPEGKGVRRAEQLGKDIQAGMLGTAEGMAGTLEWLTEGKVGRGLANKAQLWREELLPEDPNFIDDVASGVGSMATFFIPGLGAARGMQSLGTIAPKLAQWAGAGTMAMMEASTEAGQVYRDKLRESGSVEQAESSATKTFWINIPLLVITDKLGYFGQKGKVIRRRLIAGAVEATQEAGQEIISTKAKGDDIKWKDVVRSGGVGGVIGLGFGGMGDIRRREAVAPAEVQERGQGQTPQIDTGAFLTDVKALYDSGQINDDDIQKLKKERPDLAADLDAIFAPKVKEEDIDMELYPQLPEPAKQIGPPPKRLLKAPPTDIGPEGPGQFAPPRDVKRPAPGGAPIKMDQTTKSAFDEMEMAPVVEGPAVKGETFRVWVKKQGGINPNDKMWHGEITDIAKGPRSGSLRWQIGVADKNGLLMEEIIERAQQDPGWKNTIKDGNDVIQALVDNPVRSDMIEDEVDNLWREEIKRLQDEYPDGITEEEIEADLQEDVKEEVIQEAAREVAGETLTEEQLDEAARIFGDLPPLDTPGVKEQLGLFKPSEDKFELTPEKESEYDKIARLEREGVVKRPEKQKGKKVVFPKEGIKTVPGKQKQLFGEKEYDLFDQEDVKKDISFKPVKKETGTILPGPRVRMATTGELRASGWLVRNVDEAASLLAPIRKAAQENLYVITTDENGVVLEVHRVVKGTSTAAQISPIDAVGHVLNIPNAAKAYFVHNHPSGDTVPSAEDIKLADELSKYLSLKDIELESFVIGRNAYRRFSLKDPRTTQIRIKPTVKKLKIPIKERQLKQIKKFEPILNSIDANEFIEKHGSKEGFYLLDRKNVPLTFVPFESETSRKELTTKLISAAEGSNATSYFVYFKEKTLSPKRKQYLQAINKEIYGLGVLDIIVDGESMADKGIVAQFSKAKDVGPSQWGEVSSTETFINKLKDQSGAIEIGSGEYKELATIAQSVYDQGYTAFLKFKARMKSIFSEVWDKVRRLMRNLFNDAKRYAKDQAGLIGGQKAKTANIEKFSVAVEMEQSGKDRETIRKKTGWFLGMDDKWRFEIDDSKATIKNKGDWLSILTNTENERVRLQRILNHKDLYAAYPELADIFVQLRDWRKPKPTDASYNPKTNTIEVARDLKYDDFKSSLLHEIQHAIQAIEGFASGGSAEMFMKRGVDITLHGQSLDELADAIIIRKFMDRRKVSPANARRLFKDRYGRDVSGSATLLAKDAPVEDLQRQFNVGKRELEEAINLEITAPEKYRHLAGEIEAREVSLRKNLTAEQRKIVPPYLDGIPKEDAIVRFDKDIQLSAKPLTPDDLVKALLEKHGLNEPKAKPEIKKQEKAFDKNIEEDSLAVLEDFKGWWDAKKHGLPWAPQRQDITLFDMILSVPLHYAKKVPNLGRMFKAALEKPDRRYELIEGLSKDSATDKYTQKAGEDLQKQRPEEYAKLGEYLIHRDRNSIGYKVKQNEDATIFELFTPQGKKVGTYESEYIAWENAILKEINDYKTKNPKASDQALEFLRLFRTSSHKGFDLYIHNLREIIAWYESRGKEPIVVLESQRGRKKTIQIDFRVAMAEMGDRRGYYFPRKHKSGEFALRATKKDARGNNIENPRLEFFDMALKKQPGEIKNWKNVFNSMTPIGRRARKLQKQGYKVTVDVSNQLPEDVYEMIAPYVGTQATINEVLAKISEKQWTLEDFGLSMIDRGTGPGKRDFIVHGPTSKTMTPIFKDLGGKWRPSAPGEPYAWHFGNARKGFEDRLVKALMKSEDIVDHQMKTLFAQFLAEEYANVIKARGFRGHMVKRAEVTGTDVWVGYEEDPTIAIAQYIRDLSSGESKREMALKMVRAFTGTDITWQQYKEEIAERGAKADYDEYLDFVEERRIHPTEQKRAFKAGNAYMKHMLRNEEAVDRIVGIIKGLAVLKYLGGRVLAAPAINLTALATSVPATMNAYANIPIHKVPGYLAKAAKLYGQYKWGKIKPSRSIRNLFDEIETKGWHKAQYNREALSVLQSRLGKGWNRAIEWSMLAFGLSEQLNRVSTIAGTYIAIKAQTPARQFDHEAALKMAKDVSDNAHGSYGKHNYPYLAQGGKLARIIQLGYVFKTFSHHYLLNMIDIGFKKKNAKAFAYMAISPAIIAGTGAFVGKQVVFGLVNLFLKAFDKDVDDPEESFYSWADDTFGEYAENIARYGIVGALGANIKGSLEIGITDIPTTLVELLGAPGSIVEDFYYGGKSILKGDWAKGLEKVLPTALGNTIRSVREGTQGVTDRSNSPVFYGKEQLMPDMIDSIYRFISFNPARVAAAREKQWRERKVERSYSERRRAIYDKIRKFYSRPSENRLKSDWLDILEEIREYNARIRRRGLYPEIPMMNSRSIRTTLRRGFRPSKRERLRAKREADK